MEDTFNTYAPPELIDAAFKVESGNKQFKDSGEVVTSPKGAIGVAQLMPKTAKDPGFGVTPAKDSSEEENRRVGKEYLSAMLSKYNGDHEKAVAAYNAGPGAIDNILEKHGDNWKDHLPEETKGHIEKVNAAYKPSKPWTEVVKSEQFKSLPDDKKEAARNQYFEQVVKPRIKNPEDVSKAKQQFDAQFAIKKATEEDAKKFKLGSPIKEKLSGIKEGVSDFFTKPTEEQDFSLGRVVTSTALGAGTGLLGGPFSEVTVPGGAVAGLASGLAGEFGRMSGAPEGVTFALEAGAGALPEIGAKLAKSAAGKVILPSSGKTLASMIPESKGEMKAALVAKEKMFGKPIFSGMSSTEASDTTQATLKETLGNQGFIFGQGEKASDAVRNNLYSDMSDILKKKVNMTVTTPARQELGVAGVRTIPSKTVTKKVPNAFINSPAYKELNKSLDVLSERNLVSSTERNNLNMILDNQTSSNPKVAKEASQDIINLIQNGGSYTVEGETKKMISPDAQKALRESFNNYLESNTGKRTYDILKSAEEQEFISAARDSIPTILKSGFRGGKKEYIAALENIKKSPEGKSEFAKAVTQHISQLNESIDVKTGKIIQKEINPDKMISELARLKPAITRSGVMTDAQFATLENQIKALPQSISKEKRAALIKLLAQKTLSGAASAEGAKAVSNINPLGVFSL